MIEMVAQILAQVAAGLLLRFRGSKSTGTFEAVADFALDRFLGVWYLAAYSPPPFQRKLSDASTEYRRGEDGNISVINRAYDPKKQNWQVEETAGVFKLDEHTGWLVVDSSNPLNENRKIIYLNPDYTQAIIVGLTMRTLWITYRDEHLEKRDLDVLINRAEDLGFKTRMLVRVDQSRGDEWRSSAADTA